MIDIEIQYRKEKGGGITTEELQSSSESKNGKFTVFETCEIDRYMSGGYLTVVDPDYLEWLEEKTEKLIRIMNTIKSEL